MKYLSTIQYDTLRVGDPVLSAVGNFGNISGFVPREKAAQKEDNEIIIAWSNGKESRAWHFWLDQVIYLKT